MTKGAAKRPIIWLLLAALLNGCAVYDPGYPYYPAYGSAYDSYPYGTYPYGAYGTNTYGPPFYTGPAVGLGFSIYGVRHWHRGDGRRSDGHWGGPGRLR